jgi:hypothetical protein
MNQATRPNSSWLTHRESSMTGKGGTATIFLDRARAGNVTAASDRAPPGVALPSGGLADAKLDELLAGVMRSLRFPQTGDGTPASSAFELRP